MGRANAGQGSRHLAFGDAPRSRNRRQRLRNAHAGPGSNLMRRTFPPLQQPTSRSGSGPNADSRSRRSCRPSPDSDAGIPLWMAPLLVHEYSPSSEDDARWAKFGAISVDAHGARNGRRSASDRLPVGGRRHDRFAIPEANHLFVVLSPAVCNRSTDLPSRIPHDARQPRLCRGVGHALQRVQRSG